MAGKKLSPKVSVAQLESARKYHAKFDEIRARIPKGQKENYKKKAQELGYLSFNQFIIDSIESFIKQN